MTKCYSFLYNYFIDKNNYIFLGETFTQPFTKSNSNLKEYICTTLTYEENVNIVDSFLERFVDRDDHYKLGVCDKFT